MLIVTISGGRAKGKSTLMRSVSALLQKMVPGLRVYTREGDAPHKAYNKALSASKTPAPHIYFQTVQTNPPMVIDNLYQAHGEAERIRDQITNRQTVNVMEPWAYELSDEQKASLKKFYDDAKSRKAWLAGDWAAPSGKAERALKDAGHTPSVHRMIDPARDIEDLKLQGYSYEEAAHRSDNRLSQQTKDWMDSQKTSSGVSRRQSKRWPKPATVAGHPGDAPYRYSGTLQDNLNQSASAPDYAKLHPMAWKEGDQFYSKENPPFLNSDYAIIEARALLWATEEWPIENREMLEDWADQNLSPGVRAKLFDSVQGRSLFESEYALKTPLNERTFMGRTLSGHPLGSDADMEFHRGSGTQYARPVPNDVKVVFTPTDETKKRWADDKPCLSIDPDDYQKPTIQPDDDQATCDAIIRGIEADESHAEHEVEAGRAKRIWKTYQMYVDSEGGSLNAMKEYSADGQGSALHQQWAEVLKDAEIGAFFITYEIIDLTKPGTLWKALVRDYTRSNNPPPYLVNHTWKSDIPSGAYRHPAPDVPGDGYAERKTRVISAEEAEAGRQRQRDEHNYLNTKAVSLSYDELINAIEFCNKRFEDSRKVDDDNEGHGGSPGEYLYERLSELEAERDRRDHSQSAEVVQCSFKDSIEEVEKQAKATYEKLISMGVHESIARKILPFPNWWRDTEDAASNGYGEGPMGAARDMAQAIQMLRNEASLGRATKLRESLGFSLIVQAWDRYVALNPEARLDGPAMNKIRKAAKRH